MNNLLRKKTNELTKKKKKGFTLIELIIVIAIIAILAAIAIPKFGAVRENSNKTSDIANAKNISLAVSKAIAEGTVTYSSSSATGPSALNAVGSESYDITKQLDGITQTTNLKTTGHTTETFQVTISTSGNVTVTTSGGTQVYPNSSAFS